MKHALLIFLLSFLPFTVMARDIVTAEYNGVSLADAVADIASKSNTVKVNFIYDKLDEYSVKCTIDSMNPLDAIRTCIGFYPVNVRISGNRIFVEASHDELPRFSGRVSDTDGNPIEFATVRIFSPRDMSFMTGGVCNADGLFAIPVMPVDAIVRVSALGMKPIETVMKVVGETNFVMEENPVELRNVVVTHKSIVFRDNTLVTIPTALEVKHSADIFQLLMQQPVPGIFVDPVSQSLTVMGRNPVVLVDGIERDVEYLQTLNPSKVDRVEYTTDVPQKYITSEVPVGVLSIFMKERTDGGNIRANVTQAVTTGFTMGNVAATYNKGRSEFTFAYNLNRRDYHKMYVTGTESLEAHDMRIDIGSDAHNSRRFNNHSLSLGWNFTINPKMFLSVSLRDRIENSLNTSDARQTDSQKGDVQRSLRLHQNSNTPLADIYFQYKPGDRDLLEVQAATQIQNSDYDRMLADTLKSGVVEAFPSVVDMHFNHVRYNASWQHDINDAMRLEVAENGYYSRSRNQYRSIATRMVNHETSNHLSARLNMKVGRVNIGVGSGLRYITQRNSHKHRRILRNQSNLNLWLPIAKKFGFGFMASYFPGYPTLSAITEVEQDYDGYLINTGNASLKNPAVFNLSEQLSFNSGPWWAQLQMSQYMAHHLSYTTTTYLGNGKFLTRPENMNNNFNLRESLSVGGRGILDGHLTFNVTATHLFGSSCGAGWHFKRHMFLYSGSVTGYLGNCSLTFMCQRNASVFAMMYSHDTDSNRLHFDWSPVKGLNLQLGWWYVFNTDGSKTEDFNPVYQKYQRSYVFDNRRMVTIGVSWNFSFGRSTRNICRTLGIQEGSIDASLVQ